MEETETDTNFLHITPDHRRYSRSARNWVWMLSADCLIMVLGLEAWGLRPEFLGG